MQTKRARLRYAKTVSIKPAMVEATVRALEAKGYRVICAPYEGDEQLAALCVLGLADGVLTEDSDLAASSLRRPEAGSRRRRGNDVDRPSTDRGDAATRRQTIRVEASPRPGSSF